jgi:hypothetical protein
MSKLILAILFAGCVVQQAPTGPGSGSSSPTDGGNTGSGQDDSACTDNNCLCPANETCVHTCEPGSACQMKAGTDSIVAVTCNGVEACQVECSAAESCQVDCAGRDDCQVTCPPDNCVVSNIPVTDPNVLCAAIGPGNRNGTTVTCP